MTATDELRAMLDERGVEYTTVDGERMSITDELRKFANNWGWIGCTISSTVRKLLDIADRIDAEYEKNMVDALLNDGLPISYEVMAEHGWYRVLDADKQPIHIGDELDGYGCPNGGVYCRAIVNETMILVGTKDSKHTAWVMWDVRGVRQHHKPAIEDVLREFGEKYCDTIDGCADESKLLTEFAAKLQLRGDVE